MQLHHSLVSLLVSPWSNWPAMSYKRPAYRLRLQAVQDQIAACLDEANEGSLRVVSLCAGDGRDVMGVLESHERREDVRAWLVELDPKSVAAGIAARNDAGLGRYVIFIEGDATDFATYQGILPADIVVVCGVWGHVPPDERLMFVRALAKFCTPGASVVWSRGVDRGQARYTDIQNLFEENSFERVRDSVTSDDKWAICTHRYIGPATEVPTTGRIFNFHRKSGRKT